MKTLYLLIFPIFFWSNFGFSQLITSGIVLDAVSEEPLEGVSIFYDGTTIGTITNEKGFFKLDTEKLMTTNLVISYIGYETQIFDGSKTGSLKNVLLKEKVFQLDEVVLKSDTWSRQKKLTIFRREFLGQTPAGLKCKILNESDIRLYYNQGDNKLFAYASKPIIIKNNFLGYRLTYNLHDFEVTFENTLSGLVLEQSTYLAGVVFFSELNSKKTKKKYIKKRKEIYFGSILHFMRALSKKRLTEEGFKIFKEKFQIEPYSEFRFGNKNGLVEILLKAEKLSILYDDIEQSAIMTIGAPFYIDDYGNHSPPKNIFFGGKMGGQRTGNMLPLDYGL